MHLKSNAQHLDIFPEQILFVGGRRHNFRISPGDALMGHDSTKRSKGSNFATWVIRRAECLPALLGIEAPEMSLKGAKGMFSDTESKE